MLEENATILVVDDDLTNVELLNDILQSRYRVLFALNGDDAVTTAQEQNPDLILLDIVMEGSDGYDTCKTLKSHPHNIAIRQEGWPTRISWIDSGINLYY